MTPWPGFDARVKAAWQEVIDGIEHSLLTGQNVPTFDEYKRLLGQRAGMVRAREEYQTLMDKAAREA